MTWPTEAYHMPVLPLTGELIPEMWSTKVINHVRSNLVCVAAFNTMWREQLSKGDKVYIPVLTTIGATNVNPQSSFLGSADNKAFTTGPKTIDIEYWKENPIMIDDSVRVQTQVTNIFELAASNAEYGLLVAIDHQVHELIASLTTTWAGSDGQTFTDDLFIEMQEGLDEGDVPRADRSLICDPSTIADIYKIDKFMSYDYSKNPFTTDAYRGTVPAYGTPVFVSNELKVATVGHWGCLAHRESIGIVIQSAPKVEAFRVPDQHADAVNISAIFGCGVLRQGFGAAFYTRKS